MEKRFLDQIKRRTWRSPLSEDLPSRWAGSCTRKQHGKIYWAAKDGFIYLDERNFKKQRPFEADSSFWGHCMQTKQWQFTQVLQTCRGPRVPGHRLQHEPWLRSRAPGTSEERGRPPPPPPRSQVRAEPQPWVRRGLQRTAPSPSAPPPRSCRGTRYQA